MLKLNKSITVINRDVVEQGFEVHEELVHSEHKKCDGIFIDLPTPWLVVTKAKEVLKTGGSFVSFSPCIEQVMETMKVLREQGFISIRMFECMYRHFNHSKSVVVQVPVFSHKRKIGDPIPTEERAIDISKSKGDMRGHTGFLVYALKL